MEIARPRIAGVIARYHRLPVRARLVLTGILGALLGLITYELLYGLNPFARYRATSSWSANWFFSVWRQHALHRWLTFASSAPYLRSLGRAFAFYAASGVLGAWANFQLVSGLGVNHRAAWFICLCGGGLISLLFLKTFVHRET